MRLRIVLRLTVNRPSLFFPLMCVKLKTSRSTLFGVLMLGSTPLVELTTSNLQNDAPHHIARPAFDLLGRFDNSCLSYRIFVRQRTVRSTGIAE
jgi:hypothetical protein